MKDIASDYQFLLPNYKANDTKALKNLHHNCSVFLRVQGSESCIRTHLTETFQNQVNVMLCIIGSDSSDLKLNIPVRSLFEK